MAWHRGIMLKSKRELSIMREAGKVNARALLAAVEVVRPGARTKDLDAAAAEVIQKMGAKPAFLGYPGAYPYPATTTISVNDELVHGIPGDRQLQEGDIVSIDCGSIMDGFVADSALTVGVGQCSEEAERLLDVTFHSLLEGIRQMRLGNRTGDVSSAIQKYVEGHGFNVVREYTGHGVGRAMHEDPQVPNYGIAGKGIELKKGMTIALEPMVLAGGFETRILPDHWCVASRDGRLTAHFEHTVAVTKDGPLVLTAVDDLDGDKTLHYNEYFVGQSEPALK
jgi:methionyl aminopeptidase